MARRIRRWACVLPLSAATAIDGWLLAMLVVDGLPMSVPTALALHAAIAAAVSVIAGSVVGRHVRARAVPVSALSFAYCVVVPFAGVLGTAIALVPAILRIPDAREDRMNLRVIDPVALPYTVPIDRPGASRERRGFLEQLEFSIDDDVLYRRVLAADHMAARLSVVVLKRAIAHPDERIRLTAYQSLDRLVQRLDRQIQRLEDDARSADHSDTFARGLQVVELYREMLTLEADEPVARAQLLDKLERVLAQLAAIDPDDRQLQFHRGLLLLQRGRAEDAEIAFARSTALGMSPQRVLPWQAETAFARRDFEGVIAALGAVDSSLARYAPIRQVVQYWT